MEALLILETLVIAAFVAALLWSARMRRWIHRRLLEGWPFDRRASDRKRRRRAMNRLMGIGRRSYVHACRAWRARSRNTGGARPSAFAG